MRWVPEAAVSSLGLLPYFIEFLKVSGRFDSWVADCPLEYQSGNAPQKRDVLGTILLSVLAGHWRYAHISAIRGDGVNPGLLGMTKVTSEDSVRRAMKRWTKNERGMLSSIRGPAMSPLPGSPWARDMDFHGKSSARASGRCQSGLQPGEAPGGDRMRFPATIHRQRGEMVAVDVEVQAGNRDGSRHLHSRSCGHCWMT